MIVIESLGCGREWWWWGLQGGNPSEPNSPPPLSPRVQSRILTHLHGYTVLIWVEGKDINVLVTSFQNTKIYRGWKLRRLTRDSLSRHSMHGICPEQLTRYGTTPQRQDIGAPEGIRTRGTSEWWRFHPNKPPGTNLSGFSINNIYNYW